MSVYSDINENNAYKLPILEDIDSIVQSITNILTTKKNELLFLPEFGVAGEDYLFELIDDIGASLIFQELVNNISVWDNRVQLDLENTLVTPDIDNNAYKIKIAFTINGLQDPHNFTVILK
jgi:phage baseplate assembly protein W